MVCLKQQKQCCRAMDRRGDPGSGGGKFAASENRTVRDAGLWPRDRDRHPDA